MKTIFMKAARPAQRCLLALLLALPVAAGAQNDDIPTREVSVGMGFGTSNLAGTSAARMSTVWIRATTCRSAPIGV